MSKRIPTLLAALIASLMAWMIVMQAGETAPSFACERNVSGGKNLAAVVKDSGAGTTFCLTGKSYTASDDVVLQDGDALLGKASSRSAIEGTSSSASAQNVLYVSGDNVLVQHVRLHGASVSKGNPCLPDCGSGIRGGGKNLQVLGSRIDHNRNSGIGGMGDNLVVRRSDVDNNGWALGKPGGTQSSNALGSGSQAGIKSVHRITVTNTDVHHNFANGIWCDAVADDGIFGGPAFFLKNTVNANGKLGISYEACRGPAGEQKSRISGNRVTGNGYINTTTKEGGILVNTGQDLLVSDNFLKNNTRGPRNTNGSWAIWLSAGDRQEARGNVVRDNTLVRPDGILGCGEPGYKCLNNRRIGG
jgi:hypothetical protein